MQVSGFSPLSEAEFTNAPLDSGWSSVLGQYPWLKKKKKGEKGNWLTARELPPL